MFTYIIEISPLTVELFSFVMTASLGNHKVKVLTPSPPS